MDSENEVAVLFADVVGSTQLYEVLGDLRARDTISNCLDVMKKATEQNHGTVIKTIGDEVMVVALNGGLRVERTFTDDTEAVFRSLRRMEYDVTLWNGYFEHVNEYGFVDSLSGLFDVLGTVSGRKAVVLYSAMEDAPLELQFQELAAIASVSRCSVYPVDVRGLYDEGRPFVDQLGQPVELIAPG